MMNIYMKSIKIKVPCTFMAIKDHGFSSFFKMGLPSRSALSVYPSQAPCLCIYPPVSPPPWSLPDVASPALATPSRSCRLWAAPPHSVHPLMLYCTLWFLICWIFFSSTHCPQTAATFAIPVSPTTADCRLSAQGILCARLSVTEIF